MTTKKHCRPFCAALLLLLGFFVQKNAAAQTNIVFQDDFEGSSIFAGWDGEEHCCSYSLTNSTNYKRTGRKSLRVELRKSDADVSGNKRAELTDNSYPVPPETNRRWWAFSNYLPSDFGKDQVHEIVAQWHDRPKTSSVSLSPPLSLQIYKGDWIIELRYDSVDVNQDRGSNIKLKTFNLGPWQKDVWNDWVFNYNYSYNNDGYLKIWKNGQLVLDYKGKNYYNGSYDPYFKVGLYRWVWGSGWPSSLEQSIYTTRTYYVDNVKVGNKDAILQDFLVPNPVPSNISPIAYAGYKQTINLPTNTATIKGSSCSDPDGSIVSYQWSIESGPNVPNLQTPTSADLKISGMVQGTYIYRLTVTDNQGAKAFAQSIIVITGSGSNNQLPVVTAGATKLVTLPSNTVTLSALGSFDPDGSISSFLWTQESGPSSASISNIYASAPSMSGLVKGSYYFKLRITDNKGGYNSNYVQVYVNGTGSTDPPPASTNKAPIANAGNDQTFKALYSTITMNGSASYDPDGTISKYRWTQESGPSVTMSTPGAVSNIARNVVVGTYVFRLDVTDDDGAMATDKITVNVQPVSTSRIASANQSMDLAMASTPASSLAIGNSIWKWPGKSLVLYPNPVQKQIWINLNTPYIGNAFVNVYDLQGALLYQEKFYKSTQIHTHQMNIGSLPVGTYLIGVTEGAKRLGMERMLKTE
jgi:hypothetical protein